jgi:hypothetical protein
MCVARHAGRPAGLLTLGLVARGAARLAAAGRPLQPCRRSCATPPRVPAPAPRRPAPHDFPAHIWPTYLVAYAFRYNRVFGLLFILGLLADLLLQHR